MVRVRTRGHIAYDQATLELESADTSQNSIKSRKEIVVPLRLIEKSHGIFDLFLDELHLP